jgi:formylglycine-generating enzyme required for sulfatase activity
MGTAAPVIEVDGEAPLRQVQVKPIAVDPFAVTNAWFAEFVDATGYVTEAEHFGWSFVFHSFVGRDLGPTRGVLGAEWWRKVDGAAWLRPEGPGSDIDAREKHPVVHISLNDARVFAAWAGGRLPTEPEWEHAARGGLGDVRYPWGARDPDDAGFMPCNIWQGNFPRRNTNADGYAATCPVDAFEPNGYGLHNMCGNVWEWCDQPLRIRSTRRQLRAADDLAVRQGLMLAKGGSYLCHPAYCHRYRIAARTGNTADSATGHIGFRIVYDLVGADPRDVSLAGPDLARRSH